MPDRRWWNCAIPDGSALRPSRRDWRWTWGFHAERSDLPWFSLQGPSRWGALPIIPGEQSALFGENWDIERFTPADAGPARSVLRDDPSIAPRSTLAGDRLIAIGPGRAVGC